jgi:hypothetical protein
VVYAASIVFMLVVPLLCPWWMAGWGVSLSASFISICVGTAPTVFAFRARRRRWLMMHGVVGAATVWRVRRATRGQSFHVSYQFRVDGRLYGGISPIFSGEHLLQPGKQVGILYDPRNPRECDLFFLAIGSYLIVSPSDADASEGAVK